MQTERGRKVSYDKVEDWRKKLAAMAEEPPKPDQMNYRSAIAAMQTEIATLLDKGYSLTDILKSLQGEGCEISSTTLKQYWLELRAKADEKKRKITRSRKVQKADRPTMIENDNGREETNNRKLTSVQQDKRLAAQPDLKLL